MVNTTLDNQMRALSILRSLKATLENPRTPESTEGGLAQQYANALSLLQANGEDVSSFTLPAGGYWEGMGGSYYAHRDLLLSSVSSVLEYFAIRASVLQTAEEMQAEPARMIGFESSNR